jgi:hypothetical protein
MCLLTAIYFECSNTIRWDFAAPLRRFLLRLGQSQPSKQALLVFPAGSCKNET